MKSIDNMDCKNNKNTSDEIPDCPDNNMSKELRGGSTEKENSNRQESLNAMQVDKHNVDIEIGTQVENIGNRTDKRLYEEDNTRSGTA